MTEETESCGFQTTGRSEDVPKPPKYNLNAEFWRTQWSEASGAHLMEYLRAEKLQEQLNTAKYFFKNILDVNPNLEKGSYAHLSNCVNVMKNSAEKALSAIGNEGSGDE